MAECHPVGFQWVMEAKARGATLIHVDPRFTRTSALADVHVPLRAGHRHRVPRRDHQPRPGEREVLPRVRARLHQRRDDHRRGLPRHRGPRRRVLRLRPPSTRSYDVDELEYEGAEMQAASGQREQVGAERRQTGHAGGTSARGEAHGSGGAAIAGEIRTDETLQHPRCVFQVLKRHFARYTPEMVEQICGVPQEQFLRVCELLERQLGPRADQRVRLLGRLDPPHGRRAVHPHRGDPADAAGQHRPPGRRDPRAARARLASRAAPTSRRCSTSCPATSRCRTPRPHRTSTTTSRTRRPNKGYWAELRLVPGEPAQGLVGRRRQRRRTTSASTTCPA